MYIVTGASKGIGNYLCRELAARGEEVIGTYHSTKPEDCAAASFHKVDISNWEEVDAWIQSLQPRLKQVVLINCAGINQNAFAHKADVQQWENVVKTNLFGTFYTIRALLPHMRKQAYGRIINFSSVVAQTPTPGVSAYAASKSALWGLSKSLAAENGKLNITINNLNLGYVDMGIIREVSPEFQEKIKARIPCGRFAGGQDVLGAIDTLVSSPYMNGSNIDLSGGLV